MIQDERPATLLAIDTSTERAVLALAAGPGELRVETTEAARRHGRDLLPRIQSLLNAAGLRARDLELLAVGLGPGSYTGLRVGVTAAKVLAYASGAELLGLDSLAAIGRAAPGDARSVHIIADAQRGELYVSEWRREVSGGPLIPVGATRIEPLDEWLARMAPGALVLGPALGSPSVRPRLPARLLEAGLGPEAGFPSGAALVQSARELWAEGRRDSPWFLEPRYLRRSAAEDQWRGPARPSAADEGHS